MRAQLHPSSTQSEAEKETWEGAHGAPMKAVHRASRSGKEVYLSPINEQETAGPGSGVIAHC